MYCAENGNGVSSFNIRQKLHQQLHRQMLRSCAQVNQQQQCEREEYRQTSEHNQKQYVHSTQTTIRSQKNF